MAIGTFGSTPTNTNLGDVKAGHGTRKKTAAYTAVVSDGVILCDASAGAFTVTLPAVAGNADLYYTIKKIDSSANAVTVDGAGAETIDGGTTAVLANQYHSITIVCDGVEWWVL